jgi:alcohol dehydrogenase
MAWRMRSCYPHVLEFSKSHCAPRLAALARVAGIGAAGEADAALADAFIAHIRQLNADMQIPPTVRDLRREDFATIIDRAFAEAHGTYGVPRYMTRADGGHLLESVMA